MKKIVYVDMDDTLCDYMNAHRNAIKANPHNKYPQSVFDFYRNLKPLDHAIWGMNELERMGYDVWILTRPSYMNPLCYTEKRVWVEEHLGLDWCKKLIIAPDKALLKGDYLIDDFHWENFEGTQILFRGSDDERPGVSDMKTVQIKGWGSVIDFLTMQQK